jgi:acetyl/propionyl-CoA carboxylase alpha subunit
MKHSFFIITVLLFTACNQAYAQAGYEQQFNAAVAECDKDPTTRKNAVQQIKCVNNAREIIGRASGVPYLEAIYQYGILNERTARLYASGKINKDTFDDLLLQNKAAFYQDSAAVQQAQDQQNRAQWQNSVNALSNWANQQQQIQNQQNQQMLNAMPFPTTTTCRNYAGNQVRCVSQ